MAEWASYGVLRKDGTFGNVGWKPYCEAHGSPVVPVTVTEVFAEAERTHWSWIDTPAWSLTWPSEAQFQVCFPYGPEAEAEAGKGRSMWLKVVSAE